MVAALSMIPTVLKGRLGREWELEEDEISGASLFSPSSHLKTRVPLGSLIINCTSHMDKTYDLMKTFLREEFFWVEILIIVCLHSALELKKHFWKS